MAKAKTFDFAHNPSEIARQGWLAYLGLYRMAYERAVPAIETAAERYSDLVKDLVAKGELVEADAKEQFADLRTRAKSAYAAGVEQVRQIAPAAAERLPVVEVKVATRKASAKKAARKTVAKKRATKKAANKAA
jgi:polyhydroxyalkanoate synthesis regulator phasin